MTHYDDKILEFTPEWISTNELIQKIGGNKSLILKNIKDLEYDGYLDFKQKGIKKFYKRNDNGDNEIGFLGIMNILEINQQTEQIMIKQLTTIGLYKLTKKGKDLLDHVQYQVDQAYTVIVRMNYQSKLGIITQRTANERTVQLQQYIDKIMTALTSKYNNDLITEYFQNHVKRLEFKI